MRRLHPSSPLFWFVQLSYQMIIPALGALAWSTYQSQWIIYALAAAIVVGSLWQYAFFHYAMRGEQLLIKQGLLFRQTRAIPFVRIQNINTRQNPFHRVLGVATVQLESASGGKPEAILRVIDLSTVANLREKVQAAHAEARTYSDRGTRPVDVAPLTGKGGKAAESLEGGQTHLTNKPNDTVLLQMPLSDVVRYGLVSQKGMVVFALLAGLFSQSPHWYQNLGSLLAVFGWLPDWAQWSTGWQVFAVIAGVLAALLMLQLFSIAWAVFRFYDFKLIKKPSRLFAGMGLFSRMTATIPEKRIQLFRIRRNPLHRFLGGSTVTVETAGGVNTEQQGLVMRWLAPYVASDELAGFLAKSAPGINWQGSQWNPLPKRAWRRLFKRLVVMWLLAVMAMAAFLIVTERWTYVVLTGHDWSAWLVALLFVFVLPVLGWYARTWVNKAAWSMDEASIGFRSGVVVQQETRVKVDKVQVIDVSQSPFDRRHGMATLEVDTAGANLLAHHIKIPYLPLEDAKAIQTFLLHRLHNPCVPGSKFGESALQSAS